MIKKTKKIRRDELVRIVNISRKNYPESTDIDLAKKNSKMANIVSKKTGIGRGDCMIVLRAYIETIQEEICTGKAVIMDNFGKISPAYRTGGRYHDENKKMVHVLNMDLLLHLKIFS